MSEPRDPKRGLHVVAGTQPGLELLDVPFEWVEVPPDDCLTLRRELARRARLDFIFRRPEESDEGYRARIAGGIGSDVKYDLIATVIRRRGHPWTLRDSEKWSAILRVTDRDADRQTMRAALERAVEALIADGQVGTFD